MTHKNNKALLVEAHKINYRLRSTFFYRKLHEYGSLEFSDSIRDLIPRGSNYNWTEFKSFGISDIAYNVILSSDLNLIQVFAHPKLLREHPQLVGYFRNVAVLSQKATKYLSNIDPKRFESEKPDELPEQTAAALAQLFNEHISLIIENAFVSFREEELRGLLFASTGAQIDGSWRNAIGEEAEKVVQVMLVKEIIRRKILNGFIQREGMKVESFDTAKVEQVVKNIRTIKGVLLTNQKSVLFSSEPDITVVDGNGKSELVIEVKGGTDPAGALERYGASKKSLEHSLKENKNVKTCFLASCITDEVERRVRKDKTISKFFNLTEIITNENNKEEFLSFVFGVVSK